MTDPETDEQFEAFLKRRAVLPGGTPVDGKLEPPGALDEVVLKKAREAINAQQPSTRPPRWAMPLALAATVLLCLSVVLNIRLNTNRPAANLERMAAAKEGKSLQSKDIPSREAILPETKVAGSLAPRPPVVAESAAGPPQAASAPATTSAPATASAPPEASAAASRAPTMDARAARLPPAPSPAADVPAAPQPRDPHAWLREIDALRAEGKNAQADAEMRLFRATFPGYAAKPVPPPSSGPPK